MGNFLSQKQIGKNQGLCKWPTKYSQEFKGTSTLSKSKSTHSIRFLTLSPEHWLFSNFYQKIPFNAIRYLLLIYLISDGSMSSDRASVRRLACIDSFLWVNSIDCLALASWPTISLSCSIPEFTLTSYQLDLLICSLCWSSSTFLYKSLTHSFTNFLKSFTFTYDFLHNPIFMIKIPHVGPLINKVKKAQPAIKNKHMIFVFNLTPSSAAKIKTKAIPMAPLKPPYTKART